MTHDPAVSGTLHPQQTALHTIAAGAMLREAREQAGMSLDVVSAQLKLAPRQVKALEDGDFDLLPGRTFVRGFARNYARLVRLDPDTVLGALPGGTSGTLDAPPLHPTTGTMGELPSSGNTRPGLLRWGVPVLILVALASAGIYEYVRETRKATTPPASAPASRVDTNTPASGASTALPNPLVATPLDGRTSSGDGAVTPGSEAGNASASDGTSIAPLNVALRGSSWVEIRDSTGRAVLSQTVPAGQTQAVVGTPPFEVVIGNAPEVTVTFRGRVVDLAPYTHQNVARVTLR